MALFVHKKATVRYKTSTARERREKALMIESKRKHMQDQDATIAKRMHIVVSNADFNEDKILIEDRSRNIRHEHS